MGGFLSGVQLDRVRSVVGLVQGYELVIAQTHHLFMVESLVSDCIKNGSFVMSIHAQHTVDSQHGAHLVFALFRVELERGRGRDHARILLQVEMGTSASARGKRLRCATRGCVQ